MVVYKRNNLSGVSYETSIWTDVILFRTGDGAASFHSGDDHNTDFYYRMPRAGVFFVLLLKGCKAIRIMQKAATFVTAFKITFHYALSTKPERKQEVHTYIFLAPPLTLTLTDLTFAFQIALDLLWEWLTLLPK